MTPEATLLLAWLDEADAPAWVADGVADALPKIETAIEAAVRAEQAAEVERLQRRVDDLERDLAVFTKEPGVLARIGHEHVTYWYNQTRLRDADVERLRSALLSVYSVHGPSGLDCECKGCVWYRAAIAATPVAPAPNSAPNPRGERCENGHDWERRHPGDLASCRRCWAVESDERPAPGDKPDPTTLLEPAPGESDDPPLGWPVWRAWFEGMESQGRYVAPGRRSWDTLSEQDRDLDAVIETRVATFVLERHRRLQPQPAPGERCDSCNGTRWVDDENASPSFPGAWRHGRRPSDGLIPCGACNEGGWDAPWQPAHRATSRIPRR